MGQPGPGPRAQVQGLAGLSSSKSFRGCCASSQLDHAVEKLEDVATLFRLLQKPGGSCSAALGSTAAPLRQRQYEPEVDAAAADEEPT